MGENHRAQLDSIFQSHHVALAYVFGSMAKPARHFLASGLLEITDPLADIDLGVVLEDLQHLTGPLATRLRRSHFCGAHNPQPVLLLYTHHGSHQVIWKCRTGDASLNRGNP